jgi:hypothetical protein
MSDVKIQEGGIDTRSHLLNARGVNLSELEGLAGESSSSSSSSSLSDHDSSQKGGGSGGSGVTSRIEGGGGDGVVTRVEGGRKSAVSSSVRGGADTASSSAVEGGLSKAALLLSELGIDVKDLEGEGKSLDSYLRQAKEKLMNSPEFSSVKSAVKQEELKKVEKKLAKNFGLTEEEVRGKKLDELIEYIRSKNKVSSAEEGGGVGGHKEPYGNGMLVVKGGQASVADLNKLGKEEPPSSSPAEAKKEEATEKKDSSFLEGKSALGFESSSLRKALQDFNLLKIEKEKLEKEILSYRQRIQELEDSLDKIKREKQRLETEEVPRYAKELDNFKSEQFWNRFEREIMDAMRGIDLIYSHPEQIRRFILPDLKNYLKSKFDIDYKNGGLFFKNLDSSNPEKPDLRRLITEYMSENNLLARNHFTRQYINNMGKAIVAGKPEAEETRNGAPYLDKAQKNLNRLKR